MSDAERIHSEALIFNGLGGSRTLPRGRGEALDLHHVMQRGGVTGVNVTVAVSGGFAEAARAMVNIVEATERAADEGARIALTVDDLRRAKADGAAALVLGFQAGEPLEDRIEHLGVFHRLGLRILQLTYQRRNLIADGCGEPADAGLSLFGRQVVEECNRLGVLIDLSHVGERATRETIEHSAHPVSFTHVGLQSLNPVPRNKSDAAIRALAERGGVVGMIAVARLIIEGGGQTGATVDQFVDQIDRVVDLVGIDHVGIGLDISEGMTPESFEERRRGFLTAYPELRMGGDFPFENYYARGLGSMADLRNVTECLLRRGYDEASILKVLGGNFLRLFEQVWQPAS